MAATDAELIRRARWDPEALAELYLRYREPLYGWFRSRVPEAAASELTAEVFAQVALSLRRFRDEAGGSAGPWLYGIGKNLLRRYYDKGRVEEAARRRLGMPAPRPRRGSGSCARSESLPASFRHSNRAEQRKRGATPSSCRPRLSADALVT